MSGDENFEARCREVLAAHVDAVDGHARSRLNRARQLALAEVAPGRSRAFRVPGLWLPGGVLATAVVLALAVWVVRPGGVSPATVAEASPLEDAEMLSSSDGPDLLTDDAEFYDWAGSDAPGGAG